MNELDKIKEVLGRLALRRRWFRAWNGLFRGLLIAALIWTFSTILFKLLPIPFGIFGGLGLVAVLLVVGGFLWGGWRHETSLETAQWVDEKLGLKEKLSAAIEFSGEKHGWRDMLLRDGVSCLKEVSSGKLLTYHLPRGVRLTVFLLFVSATLGFVPEYRSADYLDQQRQAAIIKDTGQQLSSFTKRAIQQRPPKMKPTEKAMLSVDELGRQLNSAKLTRADALEKIASVTDSLKDQAKQLGENPALRRMQKEARQSSGAPSNTAKALQKMIESLRRQMEGSATDPAAMEKMKQQLDQLQRAASGLNSASEGLSPEMKQQMAQSLSNLSEMAQKQGLSLPELNDALSALKSADMDKFLKSLDSASVDLEKMLQMAKAMEKLQNDLAQLGKDLGEQLEKGQAQAAHDRLLEMAKEVQSGKLSPEESEKILSELSKALDPAGEYGKVREHLAEALKQGQAGEMSASAKSMEQAAAELKSLMDQMGDMQALMASLDALKKAQMCVGNCMGWGQCKSGKPGMGQGGKPGAGVGTWADENAGWFYYPQTTDRWDNSGFERPDMAARGHTDRGEGELSNGMVPTKVKGQFTPGGAMPSITLRGVSIRGESNVQFEEAITSAQSEAQSALSQQKVPRAYQQAVRSYFDDFAE